MTRTPVGFADPVRTFAVWRSVLPFAAGPR
jgi:hypothetical protein